MRHDNSDRFGSRRPGSSPGWGCILRGVNQGRELSTKVTAIQIENLVLRLQYRQPRMPDGRVEAPAVLQDVLPSAKQSWAQARSLHFSRTVINR